MDAEAEGFAQFVEARQRALQKIVFLFTQTAPKTGLKGSPTAATSSEHDLPHVQSPTGLAPHSLMGYRQVGVVFPGPAPSRNTTIRLPQLHARTNKHSGEGLNGGMTMNVVRRRIRLGGSAVVTLGAFLLALLQVTAAHAATPVHFTFTDSGTFTDTTSCSFPITVSFQGNHVGTAFFDAQGNFQSAIVETNSVGTDSANGITLRETDHFVDFFNSAGYDKEVGLPIHIQDGGVVIRDAGYILFNPDGSVAFIHGPHPQLEGDTAALCAALS